MKTQIKKWGDSAAIVLNKEFIKFHNLKLSDWVDISDIIKCDREKRTAEHQSKNVKLKDKKKKVI